MDAAERRQHLDRALSHLNRADLELYPLWFPEGGKPDHDSPLAKAHALVHRAWSIVYDEHEKLRAGKEA